MQKSFSQIYKDNFKRTFKGRATRKDFIYFTLGNIFLSILITVAASLPAVILVPTVNSKLLTVALVVIISIILVLWHIIMLVLNICITVRRFHDFNANGWWIAAQYLIIFVLAVIFTALGMKNMNNIISSLISVIYFLICICVPSNKEPNRFGEPVSHEINVN